MPTEQHEVKLCKHDIDTCIEFTNLHLQNAAQNNLKNKFALQNKREHFETILRGYLGERAVGLYFDYSTKFVPYSNSAKIDKPADVLGYEVRTVTYKNALLLTHEHDKPNADYICVSLIDSVATLKGWSGLSRTMTPENWNRTKFWRSQCYAMLETDLWPMEMLPATFELIAHQQTVYA